MAHKILIWLLLIGWLLLAIVFPASYYFGRIELFIKIALCFSILNLVCAVFVVYVIGKEINDDSSKEDHSHESMNGSGHRR